MKLKTRTFYFSMILLLFGPLHVSSSDISVCKEAIEPVDYWEIFVIPNDLKTIIEQYRDSWRKVCSNQMGIDRSLSRLLSQAKEIESQFKLAIDQEDQKFLQNAEGEGRRDRARTIDAILREKYPAFIPGFKGSYIEHSYFKPSLRKFSEAIQLGNDEDKAFFKQYSDDNLFPPWIEGTWDYGGCRRYGQFKWVGHLKAALALRNNLKSKVYLDIISGYVGGMLSELTKDWDICTCAKKESVLQDLISVSEFLKDKTHFVSAYKAINERIKAIQSGKTKIRSESEGHCSGG